MGNIIAVTSGKGGVGKSTVSVGLSFAFSKSGKTVLLVDMDEGLRCLDLMLGIDNSIVFDLSDILAGKEISDGIYYSDMHPGIHLIPAPENIGNIEKDSFSEFAKKVEDLYDVVIFDFPAGIDFSLYDCLPKDTLFLTVALPDPVSVRDAAAVSRNLNTIKANSRLVINQFDYSLTRRKIFDNIDDIIDKSALRLIGIIPKENELAMLTLKHGLKPHGKAFSAFCRISKRIQGENVLLPKLKKI